MNEIPKDVRYEALLVDEQRRLLTVDAGEVKAVVTIPPEAQALRVYGGAGGGKSRAGHLMLAAAAADPNFWGLPLRPTAPTRWIADEAVYELPSTQGLTGKSLRRAQKKARRLLRGVVSAV